MMTYTHDDTMNLSSSHNQGYMYLNRLPHGSQTILIPHDEQISYLNCQEIHQSSRILPLFHQFSKQPQESVLFLTNQI
jgi:hypothetical protein